MEPKPVWLRQFVQVRAVSCALDDEGYWQCQAPVDGESCLLRVVTDAPEGTQLRVLNLGSAWGNELVAPLAVELADPFPPYMELSSIKPGASIHIGLTPPKAASHVYVTLGVQLWR